MQRSEDEQEGEGATARRLQRQPSLGPEADSPALRREVSSASSSSRMSRSGSFLASHSVHGVSFLTNAAASLIMIATLHVCVSACVCVCLCLIHLRTRSLSLSLSLSRSLSLSLSLLWRWLTVCLLLRFCGLAHFLSSSSPSSCFGGGAPLECSHAGVLRAPSESSGARSTLPVCTGGNHAKRSGNYGKVLKQGSCAWHPLYASLLFCTSVPPSLKPCRTHDSPSHTRTCTHTLSPSLASSSSSSSQIQRACISLCARHSAI